MAGISTDDALDAAMARLADGERAAVDPVYRFLWPKLVRYCTALVGQRSEGEDLAQISLLKLFEQAHDYDPDKSAEAWALTIATWECRTHLRKRMRSKKNLDKMKRTQSEVAASSLEEEAWRRRALSALGELVAEMSPSDQQTLTDSFVRELSDPRQRKRKQRVLARLRRRWEEVHGGK